jgi:hypothetical protein
MPRLAVNDACKGRVELALGAMERTLDRVIIDIRDACAHGARLFDTTIAPSPATPPFCSLMGPPERQEVRHARSACCARTAPRYGHSTAIPQKRTAVAPGYMIPELQH